MFNRVFLRLRLTRANPRGEAALEHELLYRLAYPNDIRNAMLFWFDLLTSL